MSAATSRLGALLFALCFNHLNTISEARRARIGHTLDTAEIVVGAAPLEFLELDTPTHEDIADVAARTATRVEKILRAHGRSLDPALADETPPGLAVDEPTLAALYAAAAQGIGVSGERAGLPPLRLITAPPDRPRARDVTDAPVAEVRGINVHAAQVVDGRDRRRPQVAAPGATLRLDVDAGEGLGRIKV